MTNTEGTIDSARFLRSQISGALQEAWTSSLTKCVLDNLIQGVAKALTFTSDDSGACVANVRGQDHLKYFDEVSGEFFLKMTHFADVQTKTSHELGLQIAVSDFILLCERLRQPAQDPALQVQQSVLWDRLSLSFGDRISDFLDQFQGICSRDVSEISQTSQFPGLAIEKLTSVRDAMSANSRALLRPPFSVHPVLAYSAADEDQGPRSSILGNNSGLHVA